MDKTRRLAVFGSRTLHGERVTEIMRAEIEREPVSMIVTAGEVEGVCEAARDFARELSIPLKVHWLNFRYKRGAFERRSQAILADADAVLVIHDGQSKGTTNEKKLAEKLKRPIAYHVLTPTDTKKPDDKPPAGKPVKGPADPEVMEMIGRMR